MTSMLIVLSIAFLVCAASLIVLLKLSSRLPLDHPNERSLHRTPTPRIGGLGMLAGLCASFAFFPPHHFAAALLPGLGLAMVSLLDDYFGLTAKLRLLAQVAAAAAFLLMSGQSHLPAGIILLILIVWMTNLYNFMDGADGLAGGMAAIGFGAYGLAAWVNAYDAMAMLNWSICAAALGFLLFNFPPARLFMGDAGSVPLGFLAGALGVLGWQQHIWAGWFPLLVFSPFIVDATLTLLRRALRRQRIWQAHKSHYYQRLVRLGLSHTRLALIEYALMLGTAASAVGVSHYHPDAATPLLFAWAGFYLICGLLIDRAWQAKHGHAL
jgi:UDP-N-acetylmuramyl pentapeptide phosphotransferase/UDP-N-acetylglucosamine-1-phosphate transferase